MRKNVRQNPPDKISGDDSCVKAEEKSSELEEVYPEMRKNTIPDSQNESAFQETPKEEFRESHKESKSEDYSSLEKYLEAEKSISNLLDEAEGFEDTTLSPETNSEDITLFSQELDNDISTAYALLAATYLQDLQFGTCKSNIICFGQATDATRKAISLDENNSDAHLLAGWLFVMQKDHKNAIASLKRSISLNPNNADAYDFLGFILAMSDQPSEGIKYIQKALLLNPFPPSFYFHHLGICYRDLKEYDKAITAFKKAFKFSQITYLLW